MAAAQLKDDNDVVAQFVRAFSKHSYQNEDFARASAHVIIGQILKNQRIEKGGSVLDPRISTFAMWGPSGGKSAALDMVYIVADKVGLKFVSVDEVTDAALVGTIEEVREGKEIIYEVQKGFLGDCDILHFDEADMLFRSNTYSQNLKSYLQKALNPIDSQTSLIRKKLAHGEWIEVKPTCSLYLTSYLPSSFEETVMGTGFFQRILVVPKRLTLEQRKANSMTDIDLLGEARPTREIGEVTKLLIEVRKEFKDPVEWIFDDAKPRLRNCVDRYYTFLGELNSATRDLILGFVPRYQNMLYSLSLHYAALRFTNQISIADVNQANELIFDLLKRIVILVETKTEMGKAGARDDKRVEAGIMQVLHKLADDDGWAGFEAVAEKVMDLWRVSAPAARSMVQDLITNGFLEQARRQGAIFVRKSDT